MGANTFCCVARGRTPREALMAAKEDARIFDDEDRDDDNAGYTGDVRGKTSLTLIAVPDEFRASFAPSFAGETPESAYADALIEQQDRRIVDKNGPAGCIQVDADHFLFFGWAPA